MVLAQGITINGLPLMTNAAMTSAYNLPDLDRYYANCVIGGPGAFMIPVNDWSQFPEAVRRKLELELAAAPEVERAAVVRIAADPDYDCQKGEKMWRDRSWMWDMR